MKQVPAFAVALYRYSLMASVVFEHVFDPENCIINILVAICLRLPLAMLHSVQRHLDYTNATFVVVYLALCIYYTYSRCSFDSLVHNFLILDSVDFG